MPIEIREMQINIKVSIENAGNGHNGEMKPDSSSNQKELISDCCEAILDTINNKEER